MVLSVRSRRVRPQPYHRPPPGAAPGLLAAFLVAAELFIAYDRITGLEFLVPPRAAGLEGARPARLGSAAVQLDGDGCVGGKVGSVAEDPVVLLT